MLTEASLITLVLIMLKLEMSKQLVQTGLKAAMRHCSKLLIVTLRRIWLRMVVELIIVRFESVSVLLVVVMFDEVLLYLMSDGHWSQRCRSLRK